MTLPVFWVDQLPPTSESTLGGFEGHHAVNVRRVRTGEEFILTDGRGGRAYCMASRVGGGVLNFSVREKTYQSPSIPRLTVVQALPKGDGGLSAVDLAVQLGADEVIPWAAERCITVWKGERAAKARAKWASTAKEAAKQSRRLWFPDVAPLASAAQVVERIQRVVTTHATNAYVLHENASVSLAKQTLPSGGEIVLVIGPEGGITENELALFTRAGALAVRLGSEVLRTSSAAAAALAVVASRTRWNL